MPLEFSTIEAARDLLRRYLPLTRLVAAPSLSRATGANVYLKLETELPTGSFKPRGAIYALSVNLGRRLFAKLLQPAPEITVPRSPMRRDSSNCRPEFFCQRTRIP